MSALDPTIALRFGALACLLALLLDVARVRLERLDFAAVGLAVLAFASTLWTHTPELTSLAATNYAAVLIIFMAVRSVIRGSADVVVVVAGYLGGCITATVSLARENPQLGLKPDFGVVRVGTAGVNPNYLAYVLVTGAVLAILLIVLGRLRALACIGLVAATWGSLQAASRGGLLSLALIVAWLWLSRYRPRLTFRALVIAALGSGVAIFIGWSDRILVWVDDHTFRSTGDLARRLVVWPAVRDVISEHPVLGLGAGSSPSVNRYGIGAHNAPLELASGMGLLGLILFGLVLWGALVQSSVALEPRCRNLLYGTLIVAFTPLYLSGHWELSPAAWLVLGLYSRLGACLPELRQPRAELKKPQVDPDNRGR
jgi:O-antigen ligase